MPQGTITTNESTEWYTVKSDGAAVGVAGDLGGGSVNVEWRAESAIFPLLSETAPIILTAPDNVDLGLHQGDEIRLTVTGATAPAIKWRVSGVEKSFRTTNPNR